MGEVILYGSEKADDEKYNWNAAFNNPEFVNYLFMSSIYTNYQLEISDYEFVSLPKKITTAFFPSCYKRIGSHAFDGCSKLQYIYFNCFSYDSMIHEIGEEAFINCINLNAITINTNRKIQKRAFYSLPLLNKVTGPYFQSNPSNYTWMWYIGEEAFANCEKSIVFNNFYCVECIDKRAFYNLKNSSTYYVGQSICGKVSDYAFQNCYNLRSIELNAMAYTSSNPYLRCILGSNIFDGCTSLSTISIYGCHEIKSETFGNLRNSLESVRFDVSSSLYGATYGYDLAVNIGSYAFAGYSKLQTINASCVKEIGEYAFAGCSSLQYMSAGFALCERIKSNAFYGCTSVSQLYMNNYGSSYMISMSKKMVIESGAFNGLDNLLETNLYLCDNIPDELFYGHAKLSWCTIQNYLRYGINYSVTIGKKAFANCQSLSNIICPCVNIIEESAFYGCISLSNCTIGTELCKEIKKNAFAGCRNLSGYLTFNGGTYGIYNQYGVDVKLSIGEYAFSGCNNINGMNLINIGSIDNNAFYGCTGLSYLTIINYNFGGSDSFILSSNNYLRQGVNLALTGFRFSGNLRIEYQAFAGFMKLNMVTLDNCKYIGSYAFVGCSNLSSIALDIYNSSISNIVELENINAFDGISSSYTIMVPSILYSDYINDSIWGLISSHISYNS